MANTTNTFASVNILKHSETSAGSARVYRNARSEKGKVGREHVSRQQTNENKTRPGKIPKLRRQETFNDSLPKYFRIA